MPGPWQDPCQGHLRGCSQAHVCQDSIAALMQLLAQPAGQASAWQHAASTPTQQAPAWWHADLREGSAITPAQQPANVALQRLVSSDVPRSQARRRQLERASLPSPIKQEGHVSSALNVFVRRCQRIDSAMMHLSTSCVPLWRPLLSIKGGPRRTRGGFGSLELERHHS